MGTMQEAATELLSHQRIAVTGVSRNPKGHGANFVYQRLRDRGYEVFAVNPNADEVGGGSVLPRPEDDQGWRRRGRDRDASRDRRGDDEGMCGAGDPPRVDASIVRSRKRV